jgi:hypothetical protein
MSASTGASAPRARAAETARRRTEPCSAPRSTVTAPHLAARTSRPVNRGSGTANCRPKTTRVGHRHPSLIQQPPQPDTANRAAAVLNMHAARMRRLIAYNYQATAPCTHDTSSRIHQPTVSVDHGKRDRCRPMPVSLATLGRRQARPARRHDQPAGWPADRKWSYRNLAGAVKR